MSAITAINGSDQPKDSRAIINTNFSNLNSTKKEDSMSTNKLLGRNTAGTGAIEEITLGTGLSMTGTTLDVSAGGGDMVLASTQTNSGLKTFLNATFGLRNIANNFTGLFSNAITAARTWTLPDSNTIIPIISQLLTFSGPTASRTITLPDANFTVARTDAANTFTGVQTMTSPALTTPAITGLATGSGVASAATASTIATRDASANLSANNHLEGYTTIATAAGITTLTVTSTYYQYFTGSTTQTVVLPVTSTLSLGFNFQIVNNSSGVVTVQSSGANNILLLGAGSSAIFTCILTSGTTAASWNVIPTGYLNLPQNSQSAAYTTVISDAGKHIYHPSADTTARTWTIDSNANVPYPIGTAITFVNDTSAGTLTIAITSDTLVLAGAGTTGSRTLTANGIATVTKMTSTRWLISGINLT